VRLDEDARDRVAAEFCWFAEILAIPDASLDASGWHARLQQILDESIEITIGDSDMEALETQWTQVLCGALQAFSQVNAIEPAVQRFVSSSSQQR